MIWSDASVDEISAGSISLGRERREDERGASLGFEREERGLGRREIRPGPSGLWDLAELSARGRWGRSREIETVLALPLPLGEGGSSSPVRRPELGCPTCPCPGTGCTGRLELDSFLDAGREESVEVRRDAFFDELGLRPKFKMLPIPKLDGRCSAMLEGRAREDPLGLWKASSVRVIYESLFTY